MEVLAIVTLLMLVQYTVFSAQAGVAHGKTKIAAPKMSGDLLLEKRVRIHANTGEQLVSMIPAMWLFGTFMNFYAAAAMGGLFVVGRALFAHGYMQEDATKRTPGFLMGFVAMVLSLLGALVGVIQNLI